MKPMALLLPCAGLLGLVAWSVSSLQQQQRDVTSANPHAQARSPAPQPTTILDLHHWEVASNGLVIDARILIGPPARIEAPFDSFPAGTILRPVSYSENARWGFLTGGSSTGVVYFLEGSADPVGIGRSCEIYGESSEANRPLPCKLCWSVKPRVKDWFDVAKEDDVIWEVTIQQ